MSLYRIIGEQELTDADLVSHAEQSDRFRDNCEAHGISLFKKRTSALSAHKGAKMRNKDLGKYLAQLKIEPEHGKLHSSNDDHFTCWLYRDVTSGDIKCSKVYPVEEE